jgi:hypothetical protein
MDIVQTFLVAVASEDTRTIVVNPQDFVNHLRAGLDEGFLPATSQATLMGGCVGAFRRADGRIVTVYVRQGVPRGEVRAGNLSVLNHL